jgi:hypothetical protein
MSDTINKIKKKIKQKISDDEFDNTNALSLMRAIKRTEKYKDISDEINGIDGIEDKSELESLYEIIDNYDFNLDTFEIDSTDTIQDIHKKIQEHLENTKDDENYEEEYDEDYDEEERVKVLLKDDIRYPELFDEAEHCNNNMDCFRVDISDIINEEDKNNDVFAEVQVIYESNKGLQILEKEETKTKSYDLIFKFHKKLLRAIKEMSGDYKINKIKYRIQIDKGNYPDTERLSRGYSLHREKKHLISFWVFQNINCKNTGTVIAKRVRNDKEDKADIIKIPDNMSFVLNDSIYLHKAPKQWEILNQSERYVRSILVAEIELDHSRSNENVIHDLAHLINLPDLKIGGIRRQKTKRQKSKSQKSKSQKSKRQKSKRQKIKTKKRRNAK